VPCRLSSSAKIPNFSNHGELLASKSKATDGIIANRMVRPVSGSRPVDVSYSDRVRTDAQRIVTALADSVINSNLDRRFQTPTRRVYGTSGARLSHVHLYATASGRSLQESRTKYAKAGLMPPSSRMEAKSMEPKWQPQLPRDCVRYPALWVRTRTAPPRGACEQCVLAIESRCGRHRRSGSVPLR
jgi:hypothetical protein